MDEKQPYHRGYYQKHAKRLRHQRLVRRVLEDELEEEKPTRLVAREALSEYAEQAAEGGGAFSRHLAREAAVKAALETLTPPEQTVLTLRFGLSGEEPMSYEQVGTKLNKSRERIRQIEVKAFRKLREPTRYPWLVEHLRNNAAFSPEEYLEAKRKRLLEEWHDKKDRNKKLNDYWAARVTVVGPDWIFASTGTAEPPKPPPPPPPRVSFMPAGNWHDGRWRFQRPRIEAHERRETVLPSVTRTLPDDYAWMLTAEGVAELRWCTKNGARVVGYVARDGRELNDTVWRACVAERADLEHGLFVCTPNAATSRETAMQLVELLCHRESGRV